MNTAPSLNHRRGYIGGGNTAGILGLSPYKSRLDEYLTIQGQADAPDASRERFFKRRKALEPFATEAFTQETGRQVVRRNEHYTDEDHAYLKAEIDFEVDDGWNGETKTVHPLAARDWGPSGSDEAPLYVIAQAMHGMGINGAPGCWIHALVGLDDDRIYRIERDDDTIAAIRAQEIAFWNDHVLPQLPPEPTTIEDLRRLFPRDSGRQVEADAAAFADYQRLKYLQPLVKEVDTIKERLQLYMRDATALVDGDGRALVTWKAQSSRRFNQAEFGKAHPDLLEAFKLASDSRVMRVK